MAFLHCIAGLGLLALGCATPPAYSQTEAPTTALSSTANSLSMAVEAAWQRSAAARTLLARRDEIAAAVQAASTWTAAAPVLGLSERSDRWTGQTGQRETEISLSAPIWLPGQQSARWALAKASAEDLEAQIARLRLGIAGEVREHAWSVAETRAIHEEAKDRLSNIELLGQDVLRRVQAGDLAKTDGMLVEQETYAARAAVNAAAGRLNEARQRYLILTGMSAMPMLLPEPSERPAAEPHPRMIAARAALQRAQAIAGAAQARRNAPPTVALGMRNERDGTGLASQRTIAVSVQIPLGSATRNRPEEAAANTQIQTANAELAAAEAGLQADIALAIEQLALARQTIEFTRERVKHSRAHQQQIERAFRTGERGLAEALRARVIAHEAEASEVQHRVALGRALARLNQAKGLLP